VASGKVKNATASQLKRAQLEIARFEINTGDYKNSLARLEALHPLDLRNDVDLAYDVLFLLGVVHRRMRNYPQSEYYLQALLAELDKELQAYKAGSAWEHLGWLYLNMGDLFSSRDAAYRALDIFKRIGSSRGLADVYEELGMIALASHELSLAETCLMDSLEMRRALKSTQGVASSLRHLAMLQAVKGQWHLALRHMGISLRYYWQARALTLPRIAGMIHEFSNWLWGDRSLTL
jgi:tetratricopeptide (TPR) repeat protein